MLDVVFLTIDLIRCTREGREGGTERGEERRAEGSVSDIDNL